MKKLITLLLFSLNIQAADLIYKQGFENTALVKEIVTGLVSTGLNLKLNFNAINETLIIDSNGEFIFPQNVTVGANWTVTITTQPDNPQPQTCTLSNATGVMTITGVDNVQVSCSDTPNNWDVMKWDEGTWQ